MKIKKIIDFVTGIVVAIALSSTASAQSDASLTWSVSGIAGLKEITMDAGFTTRYISVNGVVTYTSGVSLPITGTCFGTQTGGAYCTFFVGGGFLVELALESSLNGTVKSFDSNVALRDSGIATLIEIR